MPIDVRCRCGWEASVPDRFAGKTGTCPKCGSPVFIDDPRAVRPDAAAGGGAITVRPIRPSPSPRRAFWNRPIGCSGCVGCLGIGVAGLVVLVVSSALLAPDDRRAAGPPAVRPARPAAGGATIADEMDRRGVYPVLSELFKGNPPPARIERAIEALLRDYDLPATDESRKRVASVALMFGEERGITEIKFLEYMGRHRFEGLTFPDAAALAMATYEVDYPEGGR